MIYQRTYLFNSGSYWNRNINGYSLAILYIHYALDYTNPFLHITQTMPAGIFNMITWKSFSVIAYDDPQYFIDTDLNDLVVFNDEVNTFDHVIDTLIKVCKHTMEQAEQCTLLIHYKGKCVVKMGDFELLAGMCTAIHDRGISADIV